MEDLYIAASKLARRVAIHSLVTHFTSLSQSAWQYDASSNMPAVQPMRRR